MIISADIDERSSSLVVISFVDNSVV